MANNIEKQLKEISERLEQGVKEIFTSERYTEYLNTMSKFHNYSFNNTLLITMQKPEATLVAGYQAWQKKFNRHVKRGEKGIQIIAPAPIREKQEIEKIDPVTKEPVIGDDGQPETEIVEMVIPRFRVTTVFDVSQTEGEPIAELEVPELTGSVQFYDTFMQALQNISPVPIRMMNVEGEAKGYYHQTEKYIAIKEDMSNVQTMKTGVHEVSHALLHDREVMDAEGVLKDQTTKEVEAESIAYIVCNHFGLDTSEYSFTYIASWCESRDMKALKASMDTIRKTSAEIIGNIEEQMHEIEMERPIRETFHREDVILHLSGSMGSEYSYNLVENMTAEQLQENVREYVTLLEQDEISEDEKPLEEFLEDRGATITVLYASDGVGENYPIDFFDVAYDADTGIDYFSELTPKEQAEMLVEKAEFPRTIFTEEEKAFVTEYAETFPGQIERLNDLVWDMRESYDEAGTNLVHEVIQAARANFPTTELPKERESTMQYAHRLIEAAETASHENFTESQRNLIVNFAYRMDDRDEVLGLVNRMLTANRGDRSEVMRSLVHETEAQMDNFPDGRIGFTEMHEAGIRLEHMYPLEKNRAVELYREGAEVFILHGNPDNPEQAGQILAETENAILGHDGIFGITETEWEVHKEREAAITRQEKLQQDSAEKIDETLLLHGESGRFAIYQMDTGGEHTYQFMGFESAQKLGYSIDGKDYRMVYAAPWTPTITLDDIFERFNINRPNDFHGHSLSVSDVIVINRTAETKAYYVDSFGFEELPNFVQQRMEILENNHTRAYPPVYKGTLAQAMEERDVDAYLDSRKLNIDCKKAIEEAIALKFDGLHLEEDAATQVLEQFGEERMTFVMANTLRELSYDGRFSRQNKDWAEHIEIPENINQGKNLNQDYVIESHPAVLDGFIDMARAEIRMQKIEQALDEAEVTITEDTRGFEADGHAGTWHTVDERAYAGEKFFFMEHDEYGSDVAGIIVSEHGQLVAEDLWNGYDAGALEAVSEYLQENGTTLYDLSEFPKDSVVTLRSGQTLTIKEIQAVQKDTWEETMAGKNESGTDVRFNFHAVSEVQLPEGIKLKMPEIHYVDNFYVMEDVNAEGVVKVNRYESLDEAMQEYLRLPNHQEKVLGIQNTETMQESMDFIRCKNGIDQLTHAYEQIGGWLNLEIYEAVNKMENMLDWNEVQIAYQVGKQYFTIQTAEDGYDYTFYNEDYQEDDGGIYDNPTIYVDEAASDILEDKGYSLEDAKVVDYEELMADVEEVQEEQMQRVQLEKNCPASIFEGFRREEAMQTYEGIAMQFTRSKGYLTIQATEEGYSFIFYDSDLHEIQSGDYDNPDASIQEAAYEILKNERMDDLECVKVDYKEFEEMTIQHSKELLQEGELRATSEIGRDEVALNGLSRAEVERGVLYHAQGILEDMGLENEVELLAARVHGSRSREELYRDDSDLDVVISYRGNIREDSFFNELNAHGIAMAGIKVDINPIAEERITLAEYMKESEAYLDQQEIEKLAVDLDNFSYEYDTYEYKDTVENREEQVEKITEDILNKKTGCLKDWLVEVSEESDIDSDVITARSLLSRLENTENFSIFTRQPEQEQPEATITFYVAECMEFPVMGEYHNNLTLEEAIKIYESIPAERMHGIKGIGFDLQDGDEDYSGEYGLMSGDRIDKDLIDMIPHYKESPLVQKAINDMEKYLNEKHEKVQETKQTVEVKQEVPEAPVKKESVSVEPNREQNKEPAKGGKGELKKSVLQSLKEFQARAKAQEQKEMATEKSKAHEKGDVEL